MQLKIDRQQKFQTLCGFGASGAWLAQVVGGWDFPDELSGKSTRDRISELLFSKTNGIGLDIFRYNIGGGSAHSGKGNFSQPARRTESFDAGEGKYDWNRDRNAVYMMRQAVKDGADEVVFFVNSPIERLTKNGMTHITKSKSFRENLSRKNYRTFADYCLDVTEHFVGENIPVRYLSPVNEPLWAWNGGQEGCFYRPKSVRKVFKVFANALEERKALANVKLSGAENGDIRWFNKSYTRQLLKDETVRRNLDSVDIHSYCLPAPFGFLNNRTAFMKRFRKWMDRKYPDMPIKVSEWTHMKGGRDKGMDSALVAAKTVYEDLTILNATSWQHWIAVSEVDYCDGLIYINLDSKTYETTKRLYATGNFSKYLRRGATRVAAVCDDSDVMVMAFVQDDKTVVIMINPAEKGKDVCLNLPAEAKVKTAVTDDENSLTETEHSGSEKITISAKSVTTLIF